MGFQMAARLQQHLSKHGDGRKLIAWNRTSSKADPLAQEGAQTVQHAAGGISLSPCACYSNPVQYVHDASLRPVALMRAMMTPAMLSCRAGQPLQHHLHHAGR